ncbi:MAG TPA: glycosyltransferase family 1 protein [Candidatus Binataceae bacterium]|nr:glycosyltransferase family 1 protein [Candidatus Binataceae bacterium]
MEKALIAIDFSGLDHLSIRNGQYRYAVDLVRGLAELKPKADFILLGSGPAPVAELHDVFETSGWRYLQATRFDGRAAHYRNQLALAWTALRERVDLLHVLHSPVPMLAPCPLVVTIFDLMYELFPEYAQAANSRPYRSDRWVVTHRARRILSISAATANDLDRLWGIRRARIDVVPLGSSFVTSASPHCENRNSRTRFGELCSGEALLSPYNLEPRKNLGALLKAVTALRHRRPKLRLLLFGRAAVDAEREQRFDRSVAELGLRDAVHLLGPLDDTDLAWLYGHTTAFVFPSLYEGFGLPVLEAMASGGCVVARNASAMAEIVGEAGALVETADPDALAATISALLDAPERRAQFGAAARQRAAAFTIERMARQTYASYCAALGVARNSDFDGHDVEPN